MKQFQRKRLAQAIAASLAIGGASLAYANFVELTENNPFNAITSTGERPSLVMMDLDGDGDLDAVIFHQEQNDPYPYNGYGGTSVWENTGSTSEAAFTHVVDVAHAYGYGTGENIISNPFAYNYGETYGHPVSAADVDGDGDLDFLGGQSATDGINQLVFGKVNTDAYGVVTGVVTYNRNEGYDGYGDAENPFYLENLVPTAYGANTVASFAAGDLDNDSDVDLFVMDAGTLRLYMNDGADDYGAFVFNQINDETFPLGLTSPYYGAPIVLHDVDGDGDLDLVMGTVSAAPLRVFINEGTASTASFVELVDTSGSIDVTSGGWASPSFADINGDGLDDLIVVELSPPPIVEMSAPRIVLADEQNIRVFLAESKKSKKKDDDDFLGSLGGASLLAGIMLLFRRRK